METIPRAKHGTGEPRPPLPPRPYTPFLPHEHLSKEFSVFCFFSRELVDEFQSLSFTAAAQALQLQASYECDSKAASLELKRSAA